MNNDASEIKAISRIKVRELEKINRDIENMFSINIRMLYRYVV